MATKRNLYHPAPKTNVGEKRTRKPLVQGRLVTDNATGSHRDTRLAQGHLITNDEVFDPTISPKKLVPIATEQMSPRPQLAQCLELSDADYEENQLSFPTRPKPVIVFDASHLMNSSHNTEVDVHVAYEDSPARVICHTPGKLEQSFRAENRLGENAPHAGGDNTPHWAVKMDNVQKVISTSVTSGSRQLFPDEKENLKKLKEARNKASEEENFISNQKRGIIEEILSQELGCSNMEAISLNSETSSPSPWSLSNIATTSTQKQSIVDPSASNSHSRGSNEVRTASPHTRSNAKNSKVKKASFSQAKFDNESDTSTDKIPVREKDDAQQEETNTDSETCSLYEYVNPQKKLVNRKVLVTPVKNVQDWANDNTLAAVPHKKKSARIVPSRYMQSALSRNSGQSFVISKNSSIETSTIQVQSSSKDTRQNRDKQQGQQPAYGKPAKPGISKTASKNVKVTKDRSQVAQPNKTGSSLKAQVQQSVIPSDIQNFFRSESPHTLMHGIAPTDSEVIDPKTSTPTRDQLSHFPQDIDASAIHSLSAMSINTSSASANPPSLPQDEKANSNLFAFYKHVNTKSVHKSHVQSSRSSSSSGPTALELEYWRYLQWAFLNSKSKKVFHDQEKEAMSQMHGLWKLVEAKKEEKAQVEMDVTRLKRNNLIDSELDKVETDLESILPMLPELEEDYSCLSSALDTTRHQLPTRDIYIPLTEVEKDECDEKLERALRESEQLLAEISSLTGTKPLPLSHYLDSIETIDRNFTAAQKELQSSQKDLDTMRELSTRLTSLCVQDMQSQ